MWKVLRKCKRGAEMLDLSLVKDTLRDLNASMQQVDSDLTEAAICNKDYDFWRTKQNRIMALIDEANEEMHRNVKLSKSLDTSYGKFKEQVKTNLEDSVSNTLNTWYTGEHYDIEIRRVPAGKAANYILVDRVMDSDLETICGGSATQVSGCLILSAILSGEQSLFIFYDEAFSNTDDVTAKEIGALLSAGINDMQIILIENKVELTQNTQGLQYYLHYSKEEGTHIIAIRDDYNEIDDTSPVRHLVDPDKVLLLSRYKTEKEQQLEVEVE